MAEGLGDTIEWIIVKTGLDKATGKSGCSACKKRKESLNKKFPYKG